MHRQNQELIPKYGKLNSHDHTVVKKMKNQRMLTILRKSAYGGELTKI